MRDLFRLLVVLMASLSAVVAAQQAPPLTATLTPLVESDAIRAGSTVRLAMRVVLAPELHVQSNTPADPGFIATVLTVEPPAGMTVEEMINLDLGYSPPFSPAWDPLLIACRQAAGQL